MIIRVIVLVEYGTNETIFIAKNIISILRSTREMCSFTDTYQSCPDEIQLGSEAASSDSDSDEVEPFEKNFDTWGEILVRTMRYAHLWWALKMTTF